MLFATLLHGLRWRSRITGRPTRPKAHQKPTTRRGSFVPHLGVLEDRILLSALSFSNPVNYAVGNSPQAAVLGDFNRDGRPDLAVANLSKNTVSLLLANGDGTFRPAQNFAAASGATSMAVGDFNGDGIPDLALVDYYGTNGSLLLGNGDGTFQSAQNFVAANGAFCVTVGDFNSDGKPDLAVANATSNTVSVLLGNGDGTFQPAQSFTAGNFPTSVALGDFNADGKPDLAVANYDDNTVSVLLGNGNGTFQAAQNYAVGDGPGPIAVGDFDGDGKPDLAVADWRGNTVSVLLGNGDGAFQPARNFAVGANPTGTAVGDFNGDGKLDLAVVDYFGNTVSLLLGNGDGTFQGAQNFAVAGNPIAVAVGDLNSDGKPDLAVADAGSNSVSVFLNQTVDHPYPLSATAINFSTIAGAPFSGAVASFTNADPYGNAASYTALIDWGDGSTSTGTITGNGTLTVSGSHTYADPGSYATSVRISNNLGNTTTATVYPTATVTNLGQTVQKGLEGGVGLWHNKNGQALIDSFNGGLSSTALSAWLATNFANLYGADAGANNLTGFTNAQVAAFYQSQFALSGSNLEAQVLATALNVYATTLSLGGTLGQAYGFTVSADGLGAYSYNVGADGAAFGVANNTTLDVYALLQGVNDQAVFGVLYNGTTSLRQQAGDLFGALMQHGAIS